MSNFLQRVAATVVQPRAKLQPMSGSIFAPATLYSSAAEPFQPEVSSQTAAPRHHGPLTAPRYDTSSPALADHPENKDSLFPSTVHEDSSPTRLNRSPAGQPLPPASRNLSDSRGHTHPNPFVEDSAFELTKPAANQSPGPSPYQPLIAASQPPPPRLQPRESLTKPASARTTPSEAARRFQPSQREADEIHIHIGRIEVAAIAQAPLRPAAAAARRSLNLDQYLRRGNGWPG